MLQQRKGRTALASGLAAALLVLTACASPGTTPAPPVDETRTVTLQPFTPEGELTPGLRVVQEVSGRCVPSVLSPDNDHARRCFATETSVAMDPCYVPDPELGRRLVDHEELRELGIFTVAVCLATPEQTDLTRIYVAEDTGVYSAPTNSVDPHWALELADGTRCVKVFGVKEVRENLHLSYSCDDGGYLYGIPDEELRVWMIHYREKDSDELVYTEVRTAWK